MKAKKKPGCCNARVCVCVYVCVLLVHSNDVVLFFSLQGATEDQKNEQLRT